MGDLAAQSVSALQAQLGPDGRRAWELVNGIDRTRLNIIERSQKVIDSLQFPWPAASMDALSFGIRTLLNRVFAAVQRINKAVGRMDSDVRVVRFWNAGNTRTYSKSRPTRQRWRTAW